MITQLVYLEKYDWLIKIYYAVSADYTDLILKELDDIDCEPDAFYKAADLLESDSLNIGFTYTDTDKHVSIVIIGIADSAKEFFNTLVHEITHVAMHVGEYYKLDYRSEEIGYLLGNLACEMFDSAKEFLCDHCREINFYNLGKMKVKIKKEG